LRTDTVTWTAKASERKIHLKGMDQHDVRSTPFDGVVQAGSTETSRACHPERATIETTSTTVRATHSIVNRQYQSSIDNRQSQSSIDNRQCNRQSAIANRQ
jgi:hypothetical protein